MMLIGEISALALLIAPMPEPAARPGMRREAALSGVVTEELGRPAAQCDVQARLYDPRALPGDPPAYVFSALTDARGSFELARMPDGEYAVWATAKGRSSAIELVSVRAGRQERLESPLVVRPPQAVELRLDPPRDARGRPWVLSVRGSLDEANPPAKQTPVEDGRWTHPSLVLDRYEITVGDSRGNTWRTLKMDVRGPTTLDVDLGSVAINGHVQLGKEPLAARLQFVMGGQSLTLEADASGRYRGHLPDWDWRGASSSWWVTLRAPHVARRLLARVDWPAAGQDARYDVELPQTSLRGNVLDQAGAPPGKDTWIVFPEDGTWWGFGEPPPPVRLPLEPPDPEAAPGEFLVRGLPAQTLTLRAEGPGQASQPVTCAFSAKGEARATPLVLREVVRARVRLLDARGALDWAHVLATPVGTRVGETLEESLVPADATLALELPGDTQQLALALADREGALHLARLTVRDRERVALRLPDATSRLRLSQHHPGLAGRLFLLHDGSLVELASLRRLRVSSSLDSNGALRLAVPPGHYALCALTTEEARRAIAAAAAPAGCAEGSLAAGDELSLTLATRR